MHSTATVIESQVDWLTCAVHSGRAAYELEHYARMLANTREPDSLRDEPFHVKGYAGWQRGRVRLGLREGAAIVQLSGDTAAYAFDQLVPIADSISRLDICVTARLPERDDALGRRSYVSAEAFYVSKTHAARPSFHGDADGGYTCYLGERTSARYFRLYNKEAEQHDDPEATARYVNCWRYELQTNGESTGPLASELLAREGDDRAASIQDMLWEYANRHAIAPAFAKAGDRALVPGFRRRSDRQSRLQWLRKSVAPAVARLVETGDYADVYESLGLPLNLGQQHYGN